VHRLQYGQLGNGRKIIHTAALQSKELT